MEIVYLRNKNLKNCSGCKWISHLMKWAYFPNLLMITKIAHLHFFEGRPLIKSIQCLIKEPLEWANFEVTLASMCARLCAANKYHKIGWIVRYHISNLANKITIKVAEEWHLCLFGSLWGRSVPRWKFKLKYSDWTLYKVDLCSREVHWHKYSEVGLTKD